MALTTDQIRSALMEQGHSTKDIVEFLSDIIRTKRDLADAQMKLRDKFAMAAMTGLIGVAEWSSKPEIRADAAYAHADAMIKARGPKL